MMKIIFYMKVKVGLMKIISYETRSCLDENNTCVNRSWIDECYHGHWY